MEELDFVKIGSLIFGVERIDMVMTSLTEFMAERNGAEEEPLSASKIDRFARDGCTYFSQPGAKTTTKDKFDGVISHLSFLAQNMEEITSNGQTQKMDEALSACNEVHQLIAQIIEEVGYAKLPPSFMRERIIKF